jgi:hypothetical protein
VVDVLEQLTAERAVEALLDWQQRRADWTAAWRRGGCWPDGAT